MPDQSVLRKEEAGFCFVPTLLDFCDGVLGPEVLLLKQVDRFGDEGVGRGKCAVSDLLLNEFLLNGRQFDVHE